MRIDLTPFNRSTVGFDRLFNLLDAATGDEAPAYPPYNIERLAENDYRITMAVAGFREDELNVEVREGILTVSGKHAPQTEKRAFLYQGIAARSFERRFHLADYVRVAAAKLENGLLHLDLVREIPEAMKPRRISITTDGGAKTIEGRKAEPVAA